jgi:hypothetical protein
MRYALECNIDISVVPSDPRSLSGRCWQKVLQFSRQTLAQIYGYNCQGTLYNHAAPLIGSIHNRRQEGVTRCILFPEGAYYYSDHEYITQKRSVRNVVKPRTHPTLPHQSRTVRMD